MLFQLLSGVYIDGVLCFGVVSLGWDWRDMHWFYCLGLVEVTWAGRDCLRSGMELPDFN